MSTMPPPPGGDSGLGSFLVAAIESVKALHVMVASVATELVAIRQTLLEGPDHAAEYDEHLKDAIRTAKPLVSEAIQSYDEMVARIRQLNEWKH